MKMANGSYVYKKLRNLYGNSFQSLIIHHTFKKEDCENEMKREQILMESNFKVLDVEEDDLLESVSLYQTNISETEMEIIPQAVMNTHYLTAGYLNSGECESSEKVQRQIEDLAQKVTKSIIGNRGIK